MFVRGIEVHADVIAISPSLDVVARHALTIHNFESAFTRSDRAFAGNASHLVGVTRFIRRAIRFAMAAVIDVAGRVNAFGAANDL